jgi:phosphoribosylformimino-5-aminoimidazole carboxamide ribotide isomerase
MIAIIPAIDIIEGKCVRLEQGQFSKKKVYHQDPVEVAKQFEGAGLTRLHLVDLDGARGGSIKNYRILEKIAAGTALEVDFGGGIKSDEDIRIAFNSGATQVTGGSIAVKDKPRFLSWLQEFGSEKLILGADARDKKIAVSGWEEETSLDIIEFLQEFSSHGVQYAIVTDIAKDGLLAGPSFELYDEIKGELPELRLIASGGVSSMQDVERLTERGLEGIIIGKALYEGTISLSELSRYQQAA